MNHTKIQGTGVERVVGYDDGVRHIGTASASIAPSSELQAVILGLEDRFNTLDVRLSHLSERLQPVLMPEREGPAGEEGKATMREPLSPMSERLRSMGEYAGHLADRVEYLLNHLAL